MPFAALAEETSYFSSRRRRSAKSSACCASPKARAANSRFCSAPGVLFILCKRRRALSRRSIRVEFSAVGSLRIARSKLLTREYTQPEGDVTVRAIWKISPMQKCNLIGAFPLSRVADRPRGGTADRPHRYGLSRLGDKTSGMNFPHRPAYPRTAVCLAAGREKLQWPRISSRFALSAIAPRR